MDNCYTKNSIARGFILGALANSEMTGDSLKTKVLEKGQLSEKTFNVVRAQLVKENLIENYQVNKKFFWRLKNK